jgi:iron complex outermembrane receptor protein
MIGKSIKWCLGVAVFGIVQCLFLPACFSADDKPLQMEEVVVTATRDKEEIRKVPANVTIITAREIQESGATTIPEVLNKTEGINIRSYSGNASQALIDMRGFGGDNPYSKTLIMLDGRRLNRPDMLPVNLLQIPLNNVERIEVIRGPGSVLYGDSAIGGTINIITKRGEGKPKANASVTVGSYGLHDEQVGVSGASGKISYAVTGENQFSFGYRDRSKFSSEGGGLNLGYDVSDKLALDLGLSSTKTSYDLPGQLTRSQVEQDRRQAGNPNDDGSDKYYNANLKVESFWGDYGRLAVNFLYGQKDLAVNMTSWGAFNNNLINTYGVTPKYILEKSIFGHTNKVTLGLDYYYENLNQDRYRDIERTAKTAFVKLTRESIGYYIRDEFSILSDLILSAGYRAESATIEGKDTNAATQTTIFDDKKVHNAEAYEAGLNYLIGRKSKVFAKYTTVYRIPFTDEQAVYSGFGSDEFLKNLEKEKGESYEVGTQFYPLENLRIGLSIFRTDMINEIVFNNATFRNENLDATRHEGVEFSLVYELKKWGKFYGNFTYNRAIFEAGVNVGKTVPLVPARKANAGLEIYLPYYFTICPAVRYADDAFQGGDNSNTADKVRSYTSYDLFLQYRRTYKNYKISGFIGAENLTDQKYDLILYNGYYPYPGLTVKGGVSIEF